MGAHLCPVCAVFNGASSPSSFLATAAATAASPRTASTSSTSATPSCALSCLPTLCAEEETLRLQSPRQDLRIIVVILFLFFLAHSRLPNAAQLRSAPYLPKAVQLHVAGLSPAPSDVPVTKEHAADMTAPHLLHELSKRLSMLCR